MIIIFIKSIRRVKSNTKKLSLKVITIIKSKKSRNQSNLRKSIFENNWLCL